MTERNNIWARLLEAVWALVILLALFLAVYLVWFHLPLTLGPVLEKADAWTIWTMMSLQVFGSWGLGQALARVGMRLWELVRFATLEDTHEA